MRAIVEKALMDVMYEIPSEENVEKCIITKDAIEKKEKPILVHGKDKRRFLRKGPGVQGSEDGDCIINLTREIFPKS